MRRALFAVLFVALTMAGATVAQDTPTPSGGGGGGDPLPLLQNFTAQAELLVQFRSIQMDQSRTNTTNLFFQSQTAAELNAAFADGMQSLKDLRQLTLRQIDQFADATKQQLLNAGFSPSDFAADLNDRIGFARAEVSFNYGGYTDWLELSRLDAQLSFVQDKVVHIEILIIFQYAGTDIPQGDDSATDEDIKGSAGAVEKKLQKDGKKTVKKEVNKDKDVNEALKEAKKEADEIIKGLPKGTTGEIHSAEFFGHGQSAGGGLRIPHPITVKGTDVTLLGGFPAANPGEEHSTALGSFLGTLKGIIAPGGYVIYHSCWSALEHEKDKPMRDIATLTAGFTGLTTTGYTGVCEFPKITNGEVEYLPPRPAEGTRTQTIAPDDGKRAINDDKNLAPEGKETIENAMKQAEKDVKK